MCGPTLPFALTKTYGPISVDLRDKKKLFFSFSLTHRSLSSVCPPSLFFFLIHLYFFSFSFLFFNLFWIHGSHCAIIPSLIRVCFCPLTIYFFSVQFILNELSLSHFLTSVIFVKISSFESHWQLITQKIV